MPKIHRRLKREMPESAINHRSLEAAIWKVAPAWVGGDPNDVEVREMVVLARAIEKQLYERDYQVTAGELAAAAVNEYFNA